MSSTFGGLFSSSGIIFEAYSPLGNPGQLKQDNIERSVLENTDIVDIATKHSVTAAQVRREAPLIKGTYFFVVFSFNVYV